MSEVRTTVVGTELGPDSYQLLLLFTENAVDREFGAWSSGEFIVHVDSPLLT